MWVFSAQTPKESYCPSAVVSPRPLENNECMNEFNILDQCRALRKKILKPICCAVEIVVNPTLPEILSMRLPISFMKLHHVHNIQCR